MMRMCAIAGIIGTCAEDQTIHNMLRTMARRGPDGNGVYQTKDMVLLHSRLAIIDPAGGKQPMQLSWGGETYVICYNGELYNTDEIRKELQMLGHHFCGHSDTEVVLHAYAQWKQEALNKFNGIFAFAVLEEKNARVFLARDRIGVKPLFYTLQDRVLRFASEIKTILASGVKPELDPFGASQILLLGPGRIPGSGVLKGIYELEPGQYAYFTAGKLETGQYWQLKDREHTDSFQNTVENVRVLVCDAIRRQMVSDVPIGTFLSGGLDSSIISAVCAEEYAGQGRTLDTFSVDYKDNDKYFQPGKFQPNSDTEFIHTMVSAIHTEHHWSVLTPEQLLGGLEDATNARDLPGMADVDFSLLVFCGDIRKEVKVALSGECADEIFGGYPWYRDPAIRDADGFPWAQTTAQRAALLHPELALKIDAKDFVHSLYADTVARSDILPGTPPLERRMKEMVNLNFRWFMQTLLDRKDRMSMYHGLEVRVPFCDYRIAEYLYGIPWEMKDYHGQEKGLLRKAVEGILPDAVLHRKKSPYPKTHDPKYLELVSGRMRDLLKRKDASIFQLVDKRALEALLEQDFTWPWYGQLMRRPQTIAYMLQIQYWLDAYQIQII